MTDEEWINKCKLWKAMGGVRRFAKDLHRTMHPAMTFSYKTEIQSDLNYILDELEKIMGRYK